MALKSSWLILFTVAIALTSGCQSREGKRPTIGGEVAGAGAATSDLRSEIKSLKSELLDWLELSDVDDYPDGYLSVYGDTDVSVYAWSKLDYSELFEALREQLPTRFEIISSDFADDLGFSGFVTEFSDGHLGIEITPAMGDSEYSSHIRILFVDEDDECL